MGSGLQKRNHQNKVALWAERVADCRSSGLSVREWCSKHDISTPSYYRWQKRVFDLSRAHCEPEFAEIIRPPSSSPEIAVTVRCNGVEANIHNCADTATIEAVLRVLRSC